jgi:hypothetical protein
MNVSETEQISISLSLTESDFSFSPFSILLAVVSVRRPAELTMVQDEATLVRLLSRIQKDLEISGKFSLDDASVERTLIVQLQQQQQQHRDDSSSSSPTIISLILPILQTLWRKRNQQQQQRRETGSNDDGEYNKENNHDASTSDNNNNDDSGIANCLPLLMHLWRQHVVAVSDTLVMVARERLVPTNDLMALIRVHLPNILNDIIAVKSTNDDDQRTTAILWLVHELSVHDHHAGWLYETTWEFLLLHHHHCHHGTTTTTMLLLPHIRTRIVWNWALRIPDQLACNEQIWLFCRHHWDANAAAALGNIVMSRGTRTSSMSSSSSSSSGLVEDDTDQDVAKGKCCYPDWLYEFLLESFRTTIVTRRRVMRTLKCLVVDQRYYVNVALDDLASVLVLGVLCQEDLFTQMLACQTVQSLVDQQQQQQHECCDSIMVCTPTLEYSVVQCIETAQTDKLLLIAMKLLTTIIDQSHWSRSAQCFANDQFFRQIQDFLQRNRFSHPTAAIVVAMMLQSLQQKTTHTSMDQLLCQHLPILALLLSVPSTRRLVMSILNRMVQQYSKQLAADETLLDALVMLCLEEEQSPQPPDSEVSFKDSVKGLILQLIPDL